MEYWRPIRRRAAPAAGWAGGGGARGAGLGEDLVEGPAPLRSAAEGDDAVGAGLVAAVDDRQPGRDGRVTAESARDDPRRARPREGVRRENGDALDRVR